VRNCPKRCASSSSTINGAATISVGRCSTADSPRSSGPGAHSSAAMRAPGASARAAECHRSEAPLRPLASPRTAAHRA
jgi:hypothetical protein